MVVSSQSCVRLFCNPRGLPPGSSVRGVSQQECWSDLSFPPPEALPDPGAEAASPALSHHSLPLSHHGSLLQLTSHQRGGMQVPARSLRLLTGKEATSFSCLFTALISHLVTWRSLWYASSIGPEIWGMSVEQESVRLSLPLSSRLIQAGCWPAGTSLSHLSSSPGQSVGGVWNTAEVTVSRPLGGWLQTRGPAQQTTDRKQRRPRPSQTAAKPEEGWKSTSRTGGGSLGRSVGLTLSAQLACGSTEISPVYQIIGVCNTPRETTTVRFETTEKSL